MPDGAILAARIRRLQANKQAVAGIISARWIGRSGLTLKRSWKRVAAVTGISVNRL